MLMSRARRRQSILDLLQRGPIASQEELVDALAQCGEDVTQATVSRDLKELGVVKSPAGYCLPGEAYSMPATPDTGELSTLLRRHAVAIVQADSMVVIKTGAGRAQIIALELDRFPPSGVVGTIAGDDTIFLAMSSRRDATRMTRELGDLAGVGGAAA